MFKKPSLLLLALLLAAMLLSVSCRGASLPKPAGAFTSIADYQAWADAEGYSSGALVDEGVPGINQDRFHTLPGAPGYASGRIVIGDSRCCQLGIYGLRAGLDEYAVFAAWGGHYVPGREPFIPTDGFYEEVEACFREQVRQTGRCEIFFFATVNDHDQAGGNAESIAAAMDCVKKLAAMSEEYGNRTESPMIRVIGFEGCGSDAVRFGLDPETFNRYIDDHNAALDEAVSAASLARFGFTTVRSITKGQTEFIDDGLHYADSTLAAIAEYMIRQPER